MPSTFTKDPDARLDYKVSWSLWLASGETLVSSSWIVPDGITQDSPAPSHDNTSATIWLSGGTVGESYMVTNRVTTSDNRLNDQSILIRIRDL